MSNEAFIPNQVELATDHTQPIGKEHADQTSGTHDRAIPTPQIADVDELTNETLDAIAGGGEKILKRGISFCDT